MLRQSLMTWHVVKMQPSLGLHLLGFPGNGGIYGGGRLIQAAVDQLRALLHQDLPPVVDRVHVVEYHDALSFLGQLLWRS